MFSFRTTTLFDQLDNSLLKGRIAVMRSPSAWYPVVESYLWELVALKWDLRLVFEPENLTLEFLKNYDLNAIIIEHQNTGDRYDPFLGKIYSFFNELKEADSNISIFILDHYNPCGRQVEGVHRNLLPPKHGLTLGEIANYYYSEINARFPLHIISANATMAGRDLMPTSIPQYDDFASLFSPYFHAGQYLLNATNVSHGEGTTRPYEFFGAPFMEKVVGTEAVYNKGVYMRKTSFVPTYALYAGERCYGYQLIANPSEQYNSYLHSVRLLRWMKENYQEFSFNDRLEELVGDEAVINYLNGKMGWDIVADYIKTEEQKWIRKAKKYLLYEEPLNRVK